MYYKFVKLNLYFHTDFLHQRKSLLLYLFITICLLQNSVFRADDISDDTDFYLLELQKRNFILDEGLTAYVTDEKLYISFEAFIKATEFLIHQDNDSLWTGWFYNQEHTFYLNRKTMEVKINHRTHFEIEKGEILDSKEGVLILKESLEKWFDIKLLANYRLQTLHIETEHLFPVELRSRRENKSKHLTIKEKSKPFLIEDQYHWTTYPQVYFQGNLNHSNNDGNTISSQSGVISSSFDLAKHHTFYTNSFVNSADGEITSSQRLTFEKRALTERGELFLGAGRYQLGDIFLSSNNLVLRGGSGSGFVIERNHNRNNLLDGTVIIEGNATPSWDTELYLNGQLVDFAVTGSDGRYIFSEQTTLPGKNDFLVKIFGPQGQYEEQQHIVWGGGLQLAPDDYSYRIASIDFTKELLEGDKQNWNVLPAKSATVFEYKYGLNKNLQLGLSFYNMKTRMLEKMNGFSEQNFSVASFRTDLFLGVLLGEWSKQNSNGTAKELRYLGNVGSNAFTLSLQYLDPTFRSPSTIQGVDLKSRKQITINGPLNTAFVDNYAFRFLKEETHGDSNKYDSFLRINKRLGNIFVGNELNYSRINQEASTWRGSLKVSGRFDRYSLSGFLSYDPKADDVFNSITATLRWKVKSETFANIQLTKQLTNSHDTQVNGQISWKVNGYNLNFNTAIGSKDNWSIGIGISTSFGYDGIVDDYYSSSENLVYKGRIAINAYLDKNNNMTLDEDEYTLENIRFNGVKSTQDDKQHRVSINDIPSHYPFKLKSYDLVLDDPNYTPSIKNYEVYTHPGSNLELNIPVTITGDIEGTIVTIKDGLEVGIAGLTIELLKSDNSVLTKTISEFDGYYSFLLVEVGSYRIVLKDSKSLAILTERDVTLDSDESFIEVEKIILSLPTVDKDSFIDK